MASSIRNKTRASSKRARLAKHFYLNKKLHKNLHVNRGKDIVTTWNYTDGRVAKYNYSDTLKAARPAFPMRRASELLNRNRLALENAILDGAFERPQFSYSIDENRRMIQYWWSEEDIFAAHEYFSSVHYGRPRKDGLITPYPLPTPRELRAMMDDEEVLYVQEGDRFVPTWKAK